MSFRTASAILRGKWLIDPGWAGAHMPLVLKLMKGEDVDFGFKKDESIEAKVLSHKAGSIYEVSYYTDLSRLPSGSIAMLTIAGPITKYGDSCSYGSVEHIRTMSRLGNSENVKGIILNMDTPGGEASGTAAFAEAIKSVTRLKPVIGLIDDGIAASAGMWIISACTEIYTTKKTDMVGSIGAYQTIADWYGYFESEGLKIRDIYAPQSEDKNIEYREALKGNDKPLKAELKVLVDDFIMTVRSNRAGKIKSEDWISGGMFFTKDAQQQGLIDGQKSLSEVVKRMDQLTTESNSSIINTNKMSLVKTLAAAKATAADFKTVGAGASVETAGILVQASHLESIEATLVANETAATTGANELSTANTEKKTAEDALATANSTIEANKTLIATLQAENAKLKKDPAAEITSTTTKVDKKIVETKTDDKYRTSFDDIAAAYSDK